MSEAKELIITLKDSEKTVTQKFLLYVDITFPIIEEHIAICKKTFSGEPEKIKVKAVWEI